MLASDLRRQRRNQVQIQAVCTHGSVLAEIGREADARLLVLGARGEGFLRHLMPGTTSERLLMRTTQASSRAPGSPASRRVTPRSVTRHVLAEGSADVLVSMRHDE